MSTRIGIVLEENIYKKYKEYLFKTNKTIQQDLTERIINVIKETEKHNEQ